MKFYKNILLSFGFFLLLPHCLNSQSTTKDDTASVLELITHSQQLSEKEPEAALQLLTQALNKSIELKYTNGIALAYARMGRWYFGNNINTSVDYAKKALAIFNTSEAFADEKADMHLLLAEGYDEQGHTDSSAYYYYLLGDEAESGKITDPDQLINIYTKLAIFWGNVYTGVNTDTKISETIRSYVDKVKEHSQKLKDPKDAVSRSYFVQGIYYHYSNPDSARYYYTEFLNSREKLKQPISLPRKISTLANIAETYLLQNRPDEALTYINQVKELCKNPGQANYVAFYVAFIGLMEGKALYQQKKYSLAIDVLTTSLSKLNSTGGHLRGDVVEAYKILAACNEAMGNYPAALTNKNIFITLNDSLSKKEKVDMVSRLEIKYRISQKDKELVQQQLTIEKTENKIRKKNFFITGILAFLLFSSLLLISWRKRNIQKQKLQQQNIETLQQKIKIERLNATLAGEEKERTRIARELHDGVGGLITAAKMNFELAKKNAEKVSPDFLQGEKLLEEAGSELRQAARNLMPEILLQEGLVKAVQHFCERVSEKSDTKISFQSFGEKRAIDANFELSIYRIIQELVHNIVKHSRAKNALVQINFHDDGGMNITVEDDGVGINKTTVTTVSGGMGLKNIQDRIKETGGKLDIKSNEGEGTSVYIEFESQS